MKHIESILPEHVADELTRLLLDDDTVSSALKELLHHTTGCDIPSLDNVPTSDIEEIIPLCLSILRRFWNAPLTALGDDTEKQSLADILQKAIGDRVQGNEALGIPTVNENIAAAVSALRQRDMSSGLTLTLPAGGDGANGSAAALPTSLHDGLSLAQLLCSGLADSVTELKDENVGWEFDRTLNCDAYPNIKSISLNCKSVRTGTHLSGIVKNAPNLERLELPELEGDVTFIINGQNKVKSLYLPNIKNVLAGVPNSVNVFNCIEFTEIEELYCGATGCTHSYNFRTSLIAYCSTIKRLICPNYVRQASGAIFKECPNLEYIYIPSTIVISRIGYDGNHISNLKNLHTFIAGGFQQAYYSGEIDDTRYGSFKDCPNLIHLELAKTCDMSTDIRNWSPTTALMSDPTAEGYVDLRETTKFNNNLEQFLYNFQTYIADRVADRTGKEPLTLTLSSAVYAVLEAQEGQTILATLANKNWNVAQA